MKSLKIAIATILCLAILDSFSQTTYKNIPIICDDAYITKVWAFNDETTKWGWYDITETNIEHNYGWYYQKEINIKIDRYDEVFFLFIRGFDACKDTTRLTLYGAYDSETVKDKKDLRVVFKVDGGSYELGTKIEKP